MIKNYLKIAWRSYLKKRAFSFINTFGLALGIAVCFIILLFIQDELSFDRFHPKADRIVRIHFKASINGGKIFEANVMPPVAAALMSEYPEVETATRLRQMGDVKALINGKKLKPESVALVDPNFFGVFSAHFLEGSPSKALAQPNGLVLTKPVAERYFGKAPALGKSLFLENHKDPYLVTGVIAELPANSHFHFNLFGSLAALPEAGDNNWMVSNYFTYALLKKGADYKKLEARLPEMVEKYMGPQIREAMGMTLAQFRTKGNSFGFELMPLTRIHLYSKSNYELGASGNVQHLYIFGATALLMLLIACINYVNLSTAYASKRAREVGIRKVVGSTRQELIRQFLTESFFITCLALLLAVILILLLLPVFNQLSDKHLAPGFSLMRLLALAGLGLLVSMLAGLYPAFLLASFKPVATLKGKWNPETSHYGMRSGLVVFQFFVSVCLIIGTLTVSLQMRYIQQKDLGYDKEHLIVLPNSWALGKNERHFRDLLLHDARVSDVTISAYRPAGPSGGNNALAYPVGKLEQAMRTLEYKVDERYIPTFKMKMVAGRNFDPLLASDSLAMIVNESTVQAFGWGKDAVGQKVVRQNSSRGRDAVYTVIGVVRNFHFKSLHEAISPLLMVLEPESGLIVRTTARDASGLLATMKQQWESFNTEEPFTYDFMDDLYNKTYLTEQKTSTILTLFSVLTIFVACMGLYGLAAYTVQQRAREISIRKVLGAGTGQLTGMLSGSFIRLVLVGCVLAFPLAYWAINRWLEDFAYRIPVSWWIFAGAALFALCIALLTVSAHAIRAATTNPVHNLRSE